jgi:hypothetical protein
LTPGQQDEIGDIEVSDLSCSGVYENSCGFDARQLLSLYNIYSPSSGLALSKWGEMNVPWGEINSEWGNVQINSDLSYLEGDRAVWFGDDGDYIILYEAIEDIESGPGPLDTDRWTEVCRIRISDEKLLSDIISEYPYWTEDEDNSIVKLDTNCGDSSCLYVSKSTSIPEVSPPDPEYWQRLFCAGNGKENLCKNLKKCGPGRVLVSLSSGDNDLICVPVESSDGIGPKR